MTLLAWCVAFVSGVAAELALEYAPRGSEAPAFWLIASATAAATVGLGMRAGKSRWLIAPLGALFVLGALFGWTSLYGPGPRPAADNSASVSVSAGAVVLQGTLIADPAPAREGARLRLLVDYCTPVSGPVPQGPAPSWRPGLNVRSFDPFELDVYARRLLAPPGSDRTVDGFRYGDRYYVEGRYRPLPSPAEASVGSVSAFEVHLIGESGGNAVRRVIASFRQRLFDAIRKSVSGEAGGLAAALVTGDRRGMSRDTEERFRQAGTAHLLAISGLNVTLVGGLAMGAAAWAIGRRRQLYLLAPFAVTWGYATLAGLSPSVVRAAVMFTVYLAAHALGRQRSVLPAIGLAAAVMVAVQPDVIESVSFQLSFAAVAGIAVLSPGMAERGRTLWARLTGAAAPPVGAVDAVIRGVAAGLGATIATVPLFLFHFGSFAVWGTVSTLLAMPVLAVLTISAAAAGLLGMVWPLAGQVAGWPAWLAGEYTVQLSSFFAWLPPGAIETGKWAGWTSLLLYAATVLWLGRQVPVGAALSALKAAARPPEAQPWWLRKQPPAWLTVLALMLAAAAWAGAASARSDGLLRVTFFETGQGDVIFIETPNRTQALIDGGRSADGAAKSVGGALPFWDRSLDLVLLTHSDQDHVGGLQAVVERFQVWAVAEGPSPSESTDVYEQWRKATAGHPRRHTLTGGSIIALDDGVALEVVSAGPVYSGAPDNDASVVGRLRYGNFSVLLTGDIEQAAERRLVATGLDLSADVLQAPHHGSNSSSSDSFVRAVSPQVVVVSAGNRNQYGHPHEDALTRLRTAVAPDRIFITKDRGNVTIVTDGVRLWVETTR